MERSTISLVYLLLALFSISSGDRVKPANAQEVTWCVAKPSSSDAELQDNINFACNSLGNCRMIEPNGSCYYPNTLINHASVIMNLYYVANGRNTWNCDFKNSGLIIYSNPSYGVCQYP